MQNEAACKIHAASSSPSLLLPQEESSRGKKKQIETACGMHAVSHFRGGGKKAETRRRVGFTPPRHTSGFGGEKSEPNEAASGVHAASPWISIHGGRGNDLKRGGMWDARRLVKEMNQTRRRVDSRRLVMDMGSSPTLRHPRRTTLTSLQPSVDVASSGGVIGVVGGR
jgi:hypothetical protein